jgi:hypothetical protein
MITQELVRELFNYVDGKIYWRIKKQKVTLGKEAGTLNSGGYKFCGINGKLYLVHRIIYLFHHGVLPEILDHINGDPLDNRIENLRPATHSQNLYNSKLRKDNTSGVKGVSWHKQSQKWMVRIRIGTFRKSLGLFDDLELAKLVSIEAQNKYYKEFARHE